MMNPTDKHNTETAYQQGYEDAMTGLCLPDFIACTCDECQQAYRNGQQQAIRDLSMRR